MAEQETPVVETEEKKQEGMIVVRLFKEQNGKRKYISRIMTRNKHMSGNVQVNYTQHRKYAMIFKTAHQIVQFQFFITHGNHGVKAEDLNLEREQVKKTFEEEFGKDPLGDERVPMLNFVEQKDFLEKNIQTRTAAIQEMEKIDLTELKTEAERIEVTEIIEGLKKERDIYTLNLQDLLNGKEVTLDKDLDYMRKQEETKEEITDGESRSKD